MPLVLWALCLGVLDTVLCSYSEDQCSWRGSGLSQESGSVEQISLHCAEGSLEWLYPAGALRLSLSPRLPMSTAAKGKSPRQVTTCIKPSSTFRGAQIYLERNGILELLLSEADASLRPRVHCFSWLPQEKVALFLQSTLHQDISRRIAAFRYELRGDWNSRLSLPSSNLSMEGACRPCNDTEILMAICTSDFGSPPYPLESLAVFPDRAAGRTDPPVPTRGLRLGQKVRSWRYPPAEVYWTPPGSFNNPDYSVPGRTQILDPPLPRQASRSGPQ
ncbi:meteorin isoform X2 [Chrysemys picta bellii]|uniref:meteorin isoform X2 n=1 Tax=Chrysemys picta bellii TaxID=8478 RepID=UPI0032B1AFDC